MRAKPDTLGASARPGEQLGPFCRSCDYSLRGLPEHRCPECGREFDPNDPRTMNLGRRIRPGLRWLLRPPRKAFTAVVASVCLFALVSDAAPDGYFGLFIISFMVGALLGVFWLLRLMLALGLAWYYRQPTFRCAATWGWWAVAPGSVALTVALLTVNAPFHLTFRLARPAMDRFARRAVEAKTGPPARRWVGLYPVSSVETIPSGVRFVVRGAGFMDRVGFAYSPDEPPPENYGDYYEPLSDGWYTWREAW